RDDQGLHAALQQVGEDLPGVAAHGVRGFRAVRDARGVTEIDDRFPREALEQGARHSELSDAGVEHAERRGVHGLGHRDTDADAVGSARTSSSRGKSWRCAETKASAPANRWLKIHSTSQSCTSWRLAPRLVEPEALR